MAEIVGIVASLIGPAIEVGKWIAGPIKRGFNHLQSFEDNIESLRGEAHKLKVARDELHLKVDVAQRNEEVEKLLENARNQEDIIDEIENKIPRIEKGCLNLISRYSLSKKAKKTFEDLKELHNKLEQSISAADAPSAGLMDSLPYGQDEKFESRKQIEESIMRALKDRKVNMIGICGMGGIGKTTMAERIMGKVKEENLFDEVVMVIVSQQVDMHKIQRVIAEKLGLTLGDYEYFSQNKLHEGLRNNSKRILIVLDDVWESLDLLKDFHSIPCASTTSGRCTILLTSRDRQILKIMNTQEDFEVEVLDEPEAWFLFREKTGSCTDIEDLHSIAKDVARECKGLPLALVTVGGALKGKKDRQIWDNALVQLSRSIPSHIPGVLTNVYNPLRLSYDYLESDDARSLLLLCSMFEEDSNIPLEILTWYGWGLHMFEGIKNLKEARAEVFSLVDTLKDRFLLLDGVNKDSVKMHDVLRDMAIYIASKEHSEHVTNLDGIAVDWPSWENSHRDSSWISMTLSYRTQFPRELQFQLSRLRLLMIQSEEEEYRRLLWQNEQKFQKEPHNIEFKLPDNVFYGMEEMSVLSLEYILIKSLPPTRQGLKNLKILRFFKCGILESISVVGELSKLEILSCIKCDKIETLPAELNGRLNHLRLLEIIDCCSLNTIAPGVISSLVCLEELKLLGSFDGWEGKEGRKNKNAALVELESLTNLTCLEIEIFGNPNLVSEEICLSPNIVKFDVRFVRYNPQFDIVTKSMTLRIPEKINVGNWIQKLLRSTEYLKLLGDGADKVNLLELEHVKYLLLESCSIVKKLVNTIALIPNNSFRNLTIVHIFGCNSLCYLFPLSMARNLLSQLEKLSVIECKEVEVIFCNDDDVDKMEKDGETHHLIPNMVFPKLKDLYIRDLPRLIALCKGVQGIEFPEQTEMSIIGLPKLTSLIGSRESHDDNSLMHQIFNPKVIAPRLKCLQLEDLNDNISSVWCYQTPTSFFSNLERLVINDLNGIINLMSSLIAKNLVHLRQLEIRRCKEMLQVIGDDDDEELVVQSLFPGLEILLLFCLPELRSFCKWKHPFELPSLKYFLFEDCHQMETFTKGSLNAPELISINSVDVKTKDLNEAIQQHFNPNDKVLGIGYFKQ